MSEINIIIIIDYEHKLVIQINQYGLLYNVCVRYSPSIPNADMLLLMC